MKERPILFSAPMIRAILAGRKTQTRRIGKGAIIETLDFLGGIQTEPDAPGVLLSWGQLDDDDGKQGKPQWGAFCADYPEEGGVALGVGPGQVGDRLWVRESFQALFADGIEDHYQANYKTGAGYKVYYMATDERQEFVDAEDDLRDAVTPLIFMPRWASRITLEITKVRIERLQAITDNDAIAEGVAQIVMESLPSIEQRGEYDALDVDAVSEYSTLWDRINGKRCPWEINPWVWVIEFNRVA